MGANSIRSFTIGFALTAMAIIYFMPDVRQSVISLFPLVGIPEKTVLDFLSRFMIWDKQADGKIEKKVRMPLFSKEELSKYDGGPDSLGLYLAILGEVFDVSKGAQHYKPGSSYSIFAGRDASRSYLTGDLDEGVEPDDLSGLDDSSYAGLDDWLSFYKDEYPYIGKVIGRYYDSNGDPTDELKEVQRKIHASTVNKWVEQNENEVFPPCNSEWSKEKGSRVWCTNKSGGIDRNWIGVPRKFYQAGKDPRCVCVRDSGPPSEDLNAVKHDDRGDLDNPNLREYSDCPVTSSSCKVDHP